MAPPKSSSSAAAKRGSAAATSRSLASTSTSTATGTPTSSAPASPSKPSKPSSSKPQPRLTSATAMAHNARVLDFLRSTFSAIAGSTAGILGLTGFQGFGFYIAASLFFSLLITLLKCRPGSPAKYFQTPAWELGVESMSASGLFSYVLFWTMISGVIRIYG